MNEINQTRINTVRTLLNTLCPSHLTKLTDEQIAAELVLADVTLYGVAVLEPDNRRSNHDRKTT